MNTEALPPATIGRFLLLTVQTMILARHTKAPKKDSTDTDESRVLNELGLEQAKKLGLKLKTLEEVRRCLELSAPTGQTNAYDRNQRHLPDPGSTRAHLPPRWRPSD